MFGEFVDTFGNCVEVFGRVWSSDSIVALEIR